jgi:hypothetical protein
MPDLGPFADGFRSWRNIMANAADDQELLEFLSAAGHEVATFISKGLDQIAAIDALQELASDYSLDNDQVQEILVGTIAEADELRLRASDPGYTNGQGQGHVLSPLQSSAQFVKDFVPPDYVVDGILQRRFLYSLTGKTGSGKTAVVLLLAAYIALGRPIGDIETFQGPVLYLAGENPDDVRARWIAMSQQHEFDAATIPVYFLPGRFKILEMRDRILEELRAIGSIALVVIDTSAAYFEGDEFNSNAQIGAHARMMRELVDLPGGPCVLTPCHPIKGAGADNLVPYGGGAFLNEVDGNLSCAVDGVAVEVHWQGKVRGPDFEPLSFELKTVTNELLKDSRGRLMPTVIARSLSDTAKEEISKAGVANADRLLAEIDQDGKASIAELARRCGFISAAGKEQKSTVFRLLKKLKAAKLIADEMDALVLTEKGKKRIGE